MAFRNHILRTLSFYTILFFPATTRGDHTAFFIFGDSLLDAGNNNYLNDTPKSNHWPYGETFFKSPTGRVCDGRIVPDFIAEHANLPMIKPYLEPGFDNYTYGANFASAGAGALEGTAKGPINLKQQLSNFEVAVNRLNQQLVAADARKLLSRAVYLFSIGGNDYMSFTNKPQASSITAEMRKAYMTMVLGNFTSVIKRIYVLGGRKFAFQNVGPIGCMPATRASKGVDGCFHDSTVIAKMHNIALPKLLKRLEMTTPGFKYALFDYYNSLAKRTMYGRKFGFKEGKSACCGSGAYNGNFTCGGGNNGTVNYTLCSNPSEYVWFDAAHPTESTNRQLAHLLWNGQPNVTWPYNLKTFFNMS